MALRPLAVVGLLLALAFAGCLGDASDPMASGADDASSMNSDYEVPPPDPGLAVVEESALLPGADDDVEIHVRIARPDVDEPVPVITEFTPYRALSQRQTLVEPMVDEPGGTFVRAFVKRGFAFAWADVRGTGDSSGCIDLRGSKDIADADALTEWLGTQDWSNGKVGFIGASYPGSSAHIAAIADNEHLGGVIPVVASTSFYDYHHKGGVPYPNAMGTTKAGYTGFALAPTVNPQNGNYAAAHGGQATCPHADHVAMKGALDQSGEYTDWWQDRDLNWRVDEVNVPVLMAQGLQDWNVKPDHIDDYFNALDTRKVLVAPQMPHSWPGETKSAYGDWWAFATAFFDETLRGTHTGLFDEDYAWVQDTNEKWHRYEGTWPPVNATRVPVNLTADGLSLTDAPSGTVSWKAVPHKDRVHWETPEDEQVVLGPLKLEERVHTSGTPTLNLTVTSTAEKVHLVAVLEMRTGDEWERVNYGYLNPTFRNGVDNPEPVTPGEAVPVTIDFYPQEDVLPKGAELRLTLRSVDEGGTVANFDEGEVEVALDGARAGQLWLPVSPLSH